MSTGLREHVAKREVDAKCHGKEVSREIPESHQIGLGKGGDENVSPVIAKIKNRGEPPTYHIPRNDVRNVRNQFDKRFNAEESSGYATVTGKATSSRLVNAGNGLYPQHHEQIRVVPAVPRNPLRSQTLYENEISNIGVVYAIQPTIPYETKTVGAYQPEVPLYPNYEPIGYSSISSTGNLPATRFESTHVSYAIASVPAPPPITYTATPVVNSVRSDHPFVATAAQDAKDNIETSTGVTDYEEYQESEELKNLEIGVGMTAVLRINKETGRMNLRYRCKMCNAEKRGRSHMLSHLRSHSGEQPFTCPNCSKKFRYRSNLTRHLKQKHPNIVTAPNEEEKSSDPVQGDDDSNVR
eukprot:jgi/Bigna1/91195/estExt_fgenesh1_pg.C_920050